MRRASGVCEVYGVGPIRLGQRSPLIGTRDDHMLRDMCVMASINGMSPRVTGVADGVGSTDTPTPCPALTLRSAGIDRSVDANATRVEGAG